MRLGGAARNAALALVALAVLFASGEAFLRWRHQRFVARTAASVRCERASDDPVLMYTFVPGRCGANSRGYFDLERSTEKPAGTRRIVVIGDSVAQGAGVEPAEGFARVLERSLASREPGRHEVIPLARSGYSTRQELRILETEAFDYAPDLVLWSYVLNDPAHPDYHGANGPRGRYYSRPWSRVARAIVLRLLLLRERVGVALGCPREYHARLHCVYRDQVASHLRRLGRESERSGVPFLFVVHPVFPPSTSFEDYPLEALHADLRGLAASSGLEVLDLLEAYRPFDPRELARAGRADRHDPWHPNARGHAEAARAILEHLERRGWVSGE